MSLARISALSTLPDESIVINPDVTDVTRTEQADTSNSSTAHSKTTTTITTVTTLTPTRTEVVKTTVSVTKDTAAPASDADGNGSRVALPDALPDALPFPFPTVTRTTTKETTVTTGRSQVHRVEGHSTTTAAHGAELSITSFDVL